jgi:hypothetical protein
LSTPLRKRLATTRVKFQRRPQARLPEALGPAGSTGLLRLVHHDAVTVAALCDPLLAHTRHEAPAFPSVLAIHDPTDFRCGGRRPRAGLGPLKAAAQGFFFHPCLLVSEDALHLPWGVVDAVTWARPPVAKSKSKSKSKAWRRLQNDTESARWSQQMQRVDQALHDAQQDVLHRMDREADDEALLAEAVGAGRHFVVRMCHDRLIVPGAEAPAAARKVRALFEPVLDGCCERWVWLSERTARTPRAQRIHPTRRGRLARWVFEARTVELRRPENQPGHLPATLQRNVVRAWEPEPPPGDAPVRLARAHPWHPGVAAPRRRRAARKTPTQSHNPLALKN